MPTPARNQTVIVVDDDAAIRSAVSALLDSVGQAHETYCSADECLRSLRADQPGCLVLDIQLPGMDGLEMQSELIRSGNRMPIVFISGQADVPIAVEAMRNGACDFLVKPFADTELLDCIEHALETDAAQQTEHTADVQVGRRYLRLTNREKEVMDLVVTGKPNKVIAYDLGVSQRTVEIHRSRVMKKMRARSLAELVRMHLRLLADPGHEDCNCEPRAHGATRDVLRS